MLIPFGNGKLAQKGRAFASKRNAAIFLIPAAGPGVVMHRACVGGPAVGTYPHHRRRGFPWRRRN